MLTRFGSMTFDPESRQLLRGREVVRLTPKTWKLLEILIRDRPRALSKAELLEQLWPDTFVQEVNLANAVSELRDAIGDDARKPTFVRTVYGFGYAFAADSQLPAESRPVTSSPIVFRLVWGTTEIDLAEGENVFGRDRDASIWIVDESVSRRHARIVVAGGVATLEDLGSKNGTFHRDARIAGPVRLANGDRISIGSVPMTLRVVSTTASTVTKAGDAALGTVSGRG